MSRGEKRNEGKREEEEREGEWWTEMGREREKERDGEVKRDRQTETEMGGKGTYYKNPLRCRYFCGARLLPLKELGTAVRGGELPHHR